MAAIPARRSCRKVRTKRVQKLVHGADVEDRAAKGRQLRVPLFKVHMPAREVLLPRLEAVLYSGQIGDGQIVQQFEDEFGRFIGTHRALALSSGTAALHTALLLANVGAR